MRTLSISFPAHRPHSDRCLPILLRLFICPRLADSSCRISFSRPFPNISLCSASPSVLRRHRAHAHAQDDQRRSCQSQPDQDDLQPGPVGTSRMNNIFDYWHDCICQSTLASTLCFFTLAFFYVFHNPLAFTTPHLLYTWDFTNIMFLFFLILLFFDFGPRR